jgi:hypothetical protein
MTGFEVKIREASKELTAKERVKFKDTTNAVQLDDATKENPLVIAPDFYVILDIHNERSEDKDYVKYIVVDKAGNKFVTGSESFFTAFKSIFEEMGGTNEDYEIEVYRLPSKNYKGKEFLTCSIV